jgi:hypothetical protein
MRFAWRRSWLALICIAASIPSPGAGALPCTPSAYCALQLARDAAFRQAKDAGDDENMSAALRVLQWIGEQDRLTDPAALKSRFDPLRSRLDRWPTPAKHLHLMMLAMAMGSAGLIPEARAMSDRYPDSMSRAMIETSVVSFHARRNQLEEAFAVAKAAAAAEMTQALYASIMQTLSSVAHPEMTLAAGRLGGLDAEQVKGAVAMAYLNAGNEVAARHEAMSIVDPMARQATIGLITLRCQEIGKQCKVIPLARAWLDQVRNSSEDFTPGGLAKKTSIKILVERLTEAGDFTGVLDLIAETDADRRAAPLMAVAPKLRLERDIQTAERLANGLLRVDREVALDALNIARVRLGTLSAAGALKSSSRPRATSNQLIELARELGPTQAGRARDVLQVAIDGDPRIKDPNWSEIAAVQIDLGLFSEAVQTMERHPSAARERMDSLLRLSAALAKHDHKPRAARYRAEALALFQSSGLATQEPAAVALAWLDLDELEEAEVELRSSMRRSAPAEKLGKAAEMLISRRVARGDLGAAQGFAMVWSAHQGGSSKPFTDIYAQVTHTRPPY